MKMNLIFFFTFDLHTLLFYHFFAYKVDFIRLVLTTETFLAFANHR